MMCRVRKSMRQSQRAFSLVETLLAVSIVAFIALGATLNAQQTRLFLSRVSEELALSAAFCAVVLGKEGNDGDVGAYRLRIEIGGRTRWISLTCADF